VEGVGDNSGYNVCRRHQKPLSQALNPNMASVTATYLKQMRTIGEMQTILEGLLILMLLKDILETTLTPGIKSNSSSQPSITGRYLITYTTLRTKSCIFCADLKINDM